MPAVCEREIGARLVAHQRARRGGCGGAQPAAIARQYKIQRIDCKEAAHLFADRGIVFHHGQTHLSQKAVRVFQRLRKWHARRSGLRERGEKCLHFRAVEIEREIVRAEHPHRDAGLEIDAAAGGAQTQPERAVADRARIGCARGRLRQAEQRAPQPPLKDHIHELLRAEEIEIEFRERVADRRGHVLEGHRGIVRLGEKMQAVPRGMCGEIEERAGVVHRAEFVVKEQGGWLAKHV